MDWCGVSEEEGWNDLEWVWHWKMVLLEFVFFSPLNLAGIVSLNFRDCFPVFESIESFRNVGDIMDILST